MRILLALVLLLALAAGGAFLLAGRLPGPPIEITSPEKFVGVSTPLEVLVHAQASRLNGLTITVEQNGKQYPVYTLGAEGGEIREEDDGTRVRRTIGRESIPELVSGPARILVTASRPVLYGMRTADNTVVKDVQVRLERPRVAVLSTHHYINHGGAEFVVYRATPEDVTSGVLVGDIEYPGYPASGINVPGITINDPAVRVAFYALRHDQDLRTPIRLFARDEAGNTGQASFDYRVFPKAFKKSRIEVNEQLLNEVIPAILEGTREINPQGEPIEKFVAVNSELRQKNNEKIASFASQTAPEMLWQGVVFHPFTNTGVQSAFADYRTYVYQGKEVDHQVHLGFDLASFTTTPIVAANRGRVLFADELGIYGNTVIIDHGLGVQSLYAHLSSFDVKAGDTVEKQQQIGRSGKTGMALGDHLHFTMLVNGQMVNPIEWWDPKWINDRVIRKVRDAGSGSLIPNP
ncbi:MAG TPA: M23 family metallopeptidase [Vicinamibacterales bacterium]|nr:M23 family metallopeptidase [Vicinamibacterales bacterium]